MKILSCGSIITLLTFAGCKPEQQNPSTSTIVPETPTTALEINVAQPSPHFAEVMDHLDIGGKALHFQDHEGRREFWIELIEMLMAAVPEEKMVIKANAADLVDASGFMTAAASGRSLSKEENGWLTRHYTSYPEGLPGMMKMLGEKTPFVSASRLPAATDLSLETRIDATKLPELLRGWGERLGQKEVVGQILKQSSPFGPDIETLLAGMDLNILLGLDVEPTLIPQMPVMPKHVFIQVSAKKELIDHLVPVLAEELGEPTLVDGMRAWPLPISDFPGLAKGTPHLIHDGALSLTLVSSLEHFDDVRGEGKKLADQPLFQAATNHFDSSGNLLLYTSPEIAGAALKWISARASDTPQILPLLSKLEKLDNKLPWAFYLGCEKNAIITVTEMPYPIDGNPSTALTMLSASSTLFVGARSWKTGSDRATCILQTRNIQQAVRSYQNMNGLSIGAPLDWDEIFGPGKFIERNPTCPTGGTYSFAHTFPKVGTLAGHCSHPEHVPENHQDW